MQLKFYMKKMPAGHSYQLNESNANEVVNNGWTRYIENA